jgi:hypothetical protein
VNFSSVVPPLNVVGDLQPLAMNPNTIFSGSLNNNIAITATSATLPIGGTTQLACQWNYVQW